MGTWTYKEFTNSSAANVERAMLKALRSDFQNWPPLLLKLSITDAADVDAYGIIVYYDKSDPVKLPPIYGGDRWDAADFATVKDAISHLNDLDSNESILAQLTVRKLRNTLTWTVFTAHGA